MGDSGSVLDYKNVPWIRMETFDSGRVDPLRRTGERTVACPKNKNRYKSTIFFLRFWVCLFKVPNSYHGVPLHALQKTPGGFWRWIAIVSLLCWAFPELWGERLLQRFHGSFTFPSCMLSPKLEEFNASSSRKVSGCQKQRHLISQLEDLCCHLSPQTAWSPPVLCHCHC